MCLSEMSSCNLIALASSIAISIGENLSSDELVILAAFVTALGDNLAIIATQKSLGNTNKDTSNNNNLNCK